MSAQVEAWRVSTPEGVFETDLVTLQQWIMEGCVLPTDKVSKGKLNWIEAGKAPMLRAAFNGEAAVPPATANATTPEAPPTSYGQQHSGHDAEAGYSVPPATSAVVVAANACHNHPAAAPKYICRACATPFCAECPKFVGTSRIPVCPSCGDLCRLFAEEQARVFSRQFQASGFGFADFGRALTYPFQHMVALLCGAAFYGLLLLGGFRGRIIAFVILFGSISHVINQVAWGRLDRSFLPDFSSFSLWDDLACPIGLGIGITIVTWGPMIALVIALIFGIVNGPKLSPFGGPLPAPDQSSQLTPEDLQVLNDPEADPRKLEEANQKLNRLRPGAQMAEEAEKSQKQQSDPLAGVRFLLSNIHLSLLLIALFLLTLAWAIFYYPMALAVAGYTEHFGSVINPLVGLDTIRRMGGTYFKAFGMVLLIQIVGFAVSVVVAIITSPFALPFIGNLPAMFIDGSITFYFNLVIACVLGLALHKCADRLGIEERA